MRRRVDREILQGFVEEAQSYLPRVSKIVETVSTNGSDVEALEEAHRLLHSIKGAAAMIGLTPLAHVALLPEELVEEVLEQRQELTGEAAALIQLAVDAIDEYLDQVLGERLDDRALLRSVMIPFRRFRGQPEDGDGAAIEELLGSETDEDREEQGVGDSLFEEVVQPEVFEPAEDEAVEGELIATFLHEAEEYLQSFSESLLGLEDQPDPTGLLGEMRRVVHTLKGSAGVVGLGELSRVAHRLEDLLQTLYEGDLPLDDSIRGILLDSYQVLEDLVERDADIGSLQPRIDALFAACAAVLPAEREDGVPAVEERGHTQDKEEPFAPLDGFVEFQSAPSASEPEDDQSPASTERSAPPTSSTFDPARFLRIPLDRVDELVRLVGELSVNRSVFQRAFAELGQQVDELGLGSDRVRRLAGQLEAEREFRPSGMAAVTGVGATGSVAPMVHASITPGFDPLELEGYTEIDRMSRQLTEAGADISALRGQLDRTVAEFDQSLDRLGRVTSEIQDRLLQLRMVPVGSLAPRLRRAARRTAAEQGKQVEVSILGDEIELDKTLLDELTDSLLHLVRNSIDHGIERPGVRRALGKPATGRFQVSARYAGPEVVLELSDDGSGLDPERLRQIAVERGLVNQAELEVVTDRELFNLIFVPGFSTALEVSEISGRGVGLDVVKTTVSRLKGSVTVSSVADRGTTFTIRLPMTLALARVAIVLASGQRVAVPLAGIRQILRLEEEVRDLVGDQPVLNIGDRTLPLLDLAEVLGLRASESPGSDEPIILVMSVGDQDVALGVEQLLEGREVVVKSLGAHLHPLNGVSGATILGDGSVVLILNLGELLSSSGSSVGAAIDGYRSATGAATATREILIVDDSLTVRRALSRIVSDAGWKPVPARDGLEALELLEDRAWPPDAILLDLEMPRMDGYQLTATLRARESHRDVPIIIVTSRASERHRQKAFEQGANEYLVKPLSETSLIECIRRLTSDRKGMVH